MAILNFDATQVAPDQAFGPLPAGEYQVMITDSTMRPTKRDDGQYLEIRMDVIDGDHEGRVLFDRLNLDNPNRTAVEIAQRTLSAICHAVGVLQPKDSTELHDRPMLAKVAIRPATARYEASNDVKGYRALDGAGTPSPAPVQSAAAATPTAAPAKKPWE